MNCVGSRSTWRQILPPLGDFLIFYVALATTLLVREPSAFTWLAGFLFLPLFMTWLAVMYTVGLYELRLIREDVALVRNLLISAAACMMLGTGYFYATSARIDMAPKTHLVVVVGLSHALVFGWRRAWLWLLKFELLDQRFVFLGDKAHLAEIERGMPHHAHDTGLSVGPWQYPGVDIVVADAQWVDKNWVASRDVLLAAMARNVPIVTLEDFYESIFGKVSPYYAASPSWALEFILPKSRNFYAIVKRVIDVVGAVFLLLVGARLASIPMGFRWEEDWRKREGIEPTGDVSASRPDLKSGGATSAPSASFHGP